MPGRIITALSGSPLSLPKTVIISSPPSLPPPPLSLLKTLAPFHYQRTVIRPDGVGFLCVNLILKLRKERKKLVKLNYVN